MAKRYIVKILQVLVDLRAMRLTTGRLHNKTADLWLTLNSVWQREYCPARVYDSFCPDCWPHEHPRETPIHSARG